MPIPYLLRLLKPYCFSGLLAFGFKAAGQPTVTLVLQKLPAGISTSQVYAAGNFNNWQPGLKAFCFGTHGQLRFTLPKAGTVQFKLTLGGWPTVETTQEGADVPNRECYIITDTTLYLQVPAFKNPNVPQPAASTASPQVQVPDTVFTIAGLQRTRQIRLYLPPDYEHNTQRYPVLYAMDGQNCFDRQTAPFGEWQMDETLDSIWNTTHKSAIVVAIDHGQQHRLTEYNPYTSPRFGPGEGEAFAAFIIHTLKPYIDGCYRTLPAARYTAIAGSSMGGLMSTYAWLKYPSIFGTAGIFLPAFWGRPSIFKLAGYRTPRTYQRVYLYAGGAEDSTMVPLTRRMYQQLSKNGSRQPKLVINPQAGHNESAWANQFPQFMSWWFKAMER